MTDAEPFTETPGDHRLGAAARESSAGREPASRLADAVRALAFDAALPSRPDDLAFALCMADAATQLWVQLLKFDAADPRWPDRDRCVVSAGRGGALLKALACLTGLPDADPDPLDAAGIEGAVDGPPGQGLAAAVGMALAERLLAARFGKSLVDHRTWALACMGELRAGLSHEAICLAGEQRLEKLTVLLADSGGEGDPLRDFAAHGWSVKQVDAEDPADLSAALSSAMRSKKPSAISCRARPRPLTRDDLGWPDQAFGVPGPLRARWLAAGGRGATARRAWLKRLARHPMRAEFERVSAGRPPETWRDTVAAMKTGELTAADLFRPSPGQVPELAGGGAGEPAVAAARGIRHGGRAHALAAAMNGAAMHGGVLPCGCLPAAQADVLAPSLRLAARLKLRLVHTLHEAADEAPCEHLACLRAAPDLPVFRPAGRIEEAECWDLALRRADGPSVMVMPAQACGATPPGAGGCAFGAYVAAEADGPRRATLIASGPELTVAARARELLAAQGAAVALVSMPCWELFALQDEGYRLRVLGTAPRFGIEAGGGFGWERWLGPDGVFIGTHGGAPSGYARYGYSVISAEAVCAAVVKRIGS